MADRIERALQRLEKLDAAATPVPWWLGWADGNDPEEDEPDAVCVMDPYTKELEPLLEPERDRDDDTRAADLQVTEVARNTLPAFIKLARAAQLVLCQWDPRGERLNELRAALAEIPDSVLMEHKRDEGNAHA